MRKKQNYQWKEMSLGTCYYPEHWDRKLWREDLDRMLANGIHTIRIGEFAWNKVEPREGEFTFDFFDDFLENIAPLKLGNVNIVRDYILESGDKRYFITHGDVFDSVTSNMKWLAKLGDISYNALLRINTIYNRYRMKQGKPYFSLSQFLKHKVKQAVSVISGFEGMLADLARSKKCDGVICGHIHYPENRMIDGIHYLNSGDWVESLSALVETFDGEWSIVRYPQMPM